MGQRMFFILDAKGNAVGTATAWAWFSSPSSSGNVDLGSLAGRIHWVSVSPRVQGQGLAKLLLRHVLVRLRRLHPDRDFFLTTPTTSARAVAMYLELGFVPEPLSDPVQGGHGYSAEELVGWSMLAERFGIELGLPPVAQHEQTQ